MGGHTDTDDTPPRRTLRLRPGAIAVVMAAVLASAAIAVPLLLRDGASPSGQGSPASRPGAVPPPPPGTPFRRLLPPQQGVYFGVSNERLFTARDRVTAWTRIHGVRPRIVNWFQQWLSGERRFRADWAGHVADQGAVPMITWEPWFAPAGELHVVEQPRVALRQIAGGSHDSYIRSWARDVAAYRDPVLMRPMHEMNGGWYPWGVDVNGNTARDFIAAWRHIVRIFRAEGARNVSWVWSVNNIERGGGADPDLARYYPGGGFVDWVAISGFNWGDAYSWSDWRDADAVYGPTYRALVRFRKPVMIGEIGTTDVGGDPNAWVRDTMRRLQSGYPGLHALIWYDAVDAAGLDFRLEGAMRRALARPGVLERGWLRAPRIVRVPAAPSSSRARGT
jgi:hypothetical protein